MDDGRIDDTLSRSDLGNAWEVILGHVSVNVTGQRIRQLQTVLKAV